MWHSHGSCRSLHLSCMVPGMSVHTNTRTSGRGKPQIVVVSIMTLHILQMVHLTLLFMLLLLMVAGVMLLIILLLL